MEYSRPQLQLIKKRLTQITDDLKKRDGFQMLLTASEFITWISHAHLAGYAVEKSTGRMYREKGNVRTYFE